MELKVDLEETLGFDVDVKVFDEFPLHFKFEILRSGKPLFLPRDFPRRRWLIVKKYLDFQKLKEANDRRLWGL